MDQKSLSSSFQAYTTGFILSVALTLLAYSLTVHHVLAGNALILVLASLAMIQLAVQLLFFLHLSQESRPRWRLLIFAFMVMVVAILVFGSVWIMNNLNYNQMSPKALKTYMQVNEGL